jgi:hypothetical protein
LNSGDLTVGGGSSVNVTVTLTGGGCTTVLDSSTLTAHAIVQDTLTIGAGCKVIVRPLTGSGMIGANPVPEPSTLALIAIGALSLLAYAWRRK